MNCALHRWSTSRAADARRAVPPATQKHLATCAACRAYADFCTRLPRALAVPPAADDFDGYLLRQRILARTARAPESSRSGEPAAPVIPTLGKFAEFFSNPWKLALATFAVACLLLAVGLPRQQLEREQRLLTLAALQDMRLACDNALQQGPAAVVGFLDAATQRFTAEAAAAAAAMDFFGTALPPAAQPDRS